MSRVNITELFEEHGITEEQFKAYFGLGDDVPKKVYAAITHYTEHNGILDIIKEMLNDEKIIEEIKNCPVPYQQIAIIEGMKEPPMSDKERS